MDYSLFPYWFVRVLYILRRHIHLSLMWVTIIFPSLPSLPLVVFAMKNLCVCVCVEGNWSIFSSNANGFNVFLRKTFSTLKWFKIFSCKFFLVLSYIFNSNIWSIQNLFWYNVLSIILLCSRLPPMGNPGVPVPLIESPSTPILYLFVFFSGCSYYLKII